MRSLIFAFSLSTFTAVSFLPTPTWAQAKPVPCEKMLNDARAAIKSAKLADADKAKANDLMNKGIERCKADDDAGADAFFAEILKLAGKK